MKKINLENYMVIIKNQKGEDVSVSYDIKGSIKNVIFDSRQQLDAIKLFEVMDIWKKIKDQESSVILEESEYNILKRSIDIFKGYNENDYEFVKRIKEAENYEIKE